MNTTQRNKLLARCQQAKTIGLYGFILLLPISIAFMQMSLGLLFLAIVVEAVLTKTFRFPATQVNRPLLAYIVIMMLTTLFAVPFLTSIDELRTIILKVGVFYLVYLSLQNLTQIKRAVVLLFLGVTIAASYGVLEHYLEVDIFRMTQSLALLKHVENNLTLPVRIPGFSSYMTFSGQLAMTIPILWAVWFAVKTKSQRVLLFGAGMLMLFALLWTYTRSAWVGAACAFILFGYLRVKRGSLMFLLGLLPLLLIGLQPDIRDRVVSIFYADENLERLYTWESTLRIIRDYPLTGIGKTNFSKFILTYREPYYPSFDFTSRAHAHNNILQVMVTGGIFTLLAFLRLWGVIFREMDRTYRQLPEQSAVFKRLSLGLLCAMVAFFVQGFFEHNFGDSESVMMMWCIVALSLKLPKLITGDRLSD